MRAITSFTLLISLLFPCISFADPFIEKFVESYYMDKYSNFVKKTDAGYEITAKDGTKVVLKNKETEEPDIMRYIFDTYLEDIDYLLFYIGYWESSEYLMINLKNGKQFQIPDMPNISPDKKRLTCVSFSEGENYNGIKIYKITPDGLELEWEGLPLTYDFSFHSWDGNNTIKLNGSNRPDAPDASWKPAAQRMVLNTEGWKVDFAEQDNFPIIKTKENLVYKESDIEKLRSNETLAFSYVKNNITNFEYVSSKLKDSEKFVDKSLSITQNDNQKIMVLRYISDRLQNGQYKNLYEGLVFASVVSAPGGIKNLPDKFRNNEEFIEKVLARPALKTNNNKMYFLRGISSRLKKGHYKALYQDLVFEDITQSKDTNRFKYIEDELKDDEEFVKRVLSIGGGEYQKNVLPYISERLKNGTFKNLFQKNK